MKRKLCREQIFILLFQTEFNDREEYPFLTEQFRKKEEMTDEEKDYVEKKFAAITEKIDEIDAVLNDVSTDWSTDRMGKVELAILRLGYYEMAYDNDIPESVAINEAVELAKKFGADDSYVFVNGVLGKCARDTDRHKEASEKKEKDRPWKEKSQGRVVVKGSSKKKE